MALNFPSNTQWPPAPYDDMIEAMDTWSAWWSGDTERLTEIYTNNAFARRRHGSKRRAAVDTKSDLYFWGRPNQQETKRRHVSTPASVARASAGLLFSKPPRISPGPDDEKNTRLAERMDDIFGPDAYGGELIAAGELSSALGGVYLRPWWDSEVIDHVVPSHVAADCAVPEFRFDRLVAVTFWTIVSEDGCTPVLRHLERHEKGRIYHGLYSGTENELGEKLELDAHPATEWAQKLTDADGGMDTGLDKLDVVYIPNVLPNRTWHSVPGLAPLGRSDFDGIEPEFDALDEIHTSWMRDVEDAKSRLFVDETVLEDMGPGRGGAYDPEKRVYTKLKAGLGSAADGGSPITDVKFDIRWNEHAQTSAEIKQHILEHVGLSPQHFADGPLAVGVTATEVTSRNSITETTRGAKITFWQRGLTEFVSIVMQLDAINFKTGLNITDRPTVRFVTQHTQSEAEISQNVQTKVVAGVISKEQGIKEVNPDWTDAEVEEELERILKDERHATMMALGAFPGGPADPAKADPAAVGEQPAGDEAPADDLTFDDGDDDEVVAPEDDVVAV